MAQRVAMTDRFSPSPVDPKDLYDGPDPGNVSPFPEPPGRVTFVQPQPSDRRSRPEYVAMITAALDMLGARLLALIAVIAACAMWSWSVYHPEPDRLYAAVGFSLTVLMPLVV